MAKQGSKRQESSRPIRVFEAFSGIGAQHAALRRLGIDFEIVGTSDWFINAILCYDAIHYGDTPKVLLPSYEDQLKYLSQFNFSKDSVTPFKDISRLGKKGVAALYQAQKRSKNLGSIVDLKPENMPEMDLLVYSFPCQDLSTGGNGKGMGKGSGTRSCLIWEIRRILMGLKKRGCLPKYLLMENVKAIQHDRYKEDFTKWKQMLNHLGYKNGRVAVLDATDFGIPQDRQRAFMVSCLGDESIDIESRIKKLPRGNVNDFLYMDYTNPVYKAEADDARLNATPHRKIMWRKNKRVAPFTDKTVIHTITCNMDRTNTAALFDYGDAYRRLTIREAFRLMGFSIAEYERAMSLRLTYRQMNKLIGNAIVVPVLTELFRVLFGSKEKGVPK